MQPRRRGSAEQWRILRWRMMHETEAFLEDGLRNPQRYLSIPAIPVGQGDFPRGFASLFWAQVLGSS